MKRGQEVSRADRITTGISNIGFLLTLYSPSSRLNRARSPERSRTSIEAAKQLVNCSIIRLITYRTGDFRAFLYAIEQAEKPESPAPNHESAGIEISVADQSPLSGAYWGYSKKGCEIKNLRDEIQRLKKTTFDRIIKPSRLLLAIRQGERKMAPRKTSGLGETKKTKNRTALM